MGDVARFVRIVVLAHGHSEAVAEVAQLDESEPQCEKDAAAQQQYDHERDGLVPDRDPEIDDAVVSEVGKYLNELHAAPLLGPGPGRQRTGSGGQLCPTK